MNFVIRRDYAKQEVKPAKTKEQKPAQKPAKAKSEKKA